MFRLFLTIDQTINGSISIILLFEYYKLIINDDTGYIITSTQNKKNHKIL